MKILIVSHNPLSPQSNMGKTLSSLFSGFRKEELCQLYIYPTVPSRAVCSSYYRVTDKEALVSLLTGKPIGGPIPAGRIRQSQGAFEDPGDEKLYRSRKNKSSLRRFARDGIWRLAKWHSPGLKAWLDEQQPEIIFAAPGAAFFLYDMALELARARQLPLVTYLCDEYYFTDTPKAGLDRFRHFLLRRRMEQLLGRSAHLAVISRELRQAYEPHFGLPVTVVMTGAGIVPAARPRCAQPPDTLSYFGNIRCNRYRTLAQIAQTLAQLNREQGTRYRLRIHTAEQDPTLLAALKAWDTVELMPYLSGADYEQALKQAQLLVHTEAFDRESRQRVKGSISTKLADYLASGVPVLAYGPPEIASMGHLSRSGSALCVTDPQDLKAGLFSLLTDGALREDLARRALETAARCHDPAVTGAAVREILEKARGRQRKLLQVNSLLDHQSTGKITALIHDTLRRRGIPVITVYGRGQTQRRPGVIRLCPEWYGKLQGLRVRLGGLPYGGCLLSTWRLQTLIRRERPDVVHLQCVNGHFLNLYRLISWLKARRVPTVVTLHAEFFYTAGCGHAFDCRQWEFGCQKCSQGGHRSWEKMRRAFAGFGAGALVPVSEWVAQRAARAPILRGIPMYCLPNPVDTRVFRPGIAARENQTVAYVTAHFDLKPEHPKGAAWLVALARRMPEVKFYVAGPGAASGNLPANVIYLGQIRDPAQLAALYCRACVTLITSRRETFSMPCAESLCCGTPAVGFQAGGPESAMPGVYSEFVPYGDLEALQQAVTRWLARPAPPEAVAALAREWFGPEKIGEKLEKLYETLYR